MIEVSAFQRLGGFTLDAAFAAESRFIALFGHSGSGKTTLLNVVAGLLRPERGRVVVDGTTLFDSDRGIFLPPYRRQLGTVFQEGRLFPHLSVRQNSALRRVVRTPVRKGSEARSRRGLARHRASAQPLSEPALGR